MTNSRLLVLCTALLCSTILRAETPRENTYVWAPGEDHSGWKGMSNYPTGYVIAGSKFFEPNNTQVYITGFNDLSQHQWTVPHPTAQHGFSSLQTFWKSFTNIGAAGNPSGFFILATGTRNGVNSYYTLQTNKVGQFTSERFGDFPSGIQFGGVCQAVNGGYIATGSDGSGDIVVAKFNAAGELEWHKILPHSGFGWTIQPASGGGYVIGSTTARATRIDVDGNVVWSTLVALPPSPPHDGSAYTYTEFEEILPMQNTGSGFVMTGSAFSNSTSAAYTARVNWDGTVPWNKINDFTNTSDPTTPVAWSNSPVEMLNPVSGQWDILYTWRKGPVSSGGTLYAERMNPANGAQVQFGSLHNTIPVQEAFTVRQHFVNRIIVAGTRGSYDAVYSYAADNLPETLSLSIFKKSEPAGEGTQKRQNVGVSNALPEFE